MKKKITIDMFCNCFYQINRFGCDDNIIVLDEKKYCNNISHYVKLFIVAVIGKNKFKYQYGRQYRLKNFKCHRVKLPIKHNSDGSIYIDDSHKFSNKGYVPDWQFMENYIKSLPFGDRI